MDTKKLKAANIPESQWLDCYISADGMIFTPQFNSSGGITKTGEQAYNEWLINKDKPPQPSETDLLKTKIAQLESSLAATQLYMNKKAGV